MIVKGIIKYDDGTETFAADLTPRTIQELAERRAQAASHYRNLGMMNAYGLTPEISRTERRLGERAAS